MSAWLTGLRSARTRRVKDGSRQPRAVAVQAAQQGKLTICRDGRIRTKDPAGPTHAWERSGGIVAA